MHEMSIATALMDQLIAIAEKNNLQAIDEFTVTAGAIRQIVPEALEMAFEALAAGTVAQEAVIHLEVESAMVRCRHCQNEFEPEPDSYLCTRCNHADVEFIRGNDIILKSVTGRQKDLK